MKHVLAAVCAGALVAPAPGLAQTGWFDLEVPGSVERILGSRVPHPAGPRLLRDLIGVLHDPGAAAVNRTGAAAFRACLTELQRLRTRWRAVDRAAGEVSLRRAAERADGRRALEALLDSFGLHLARAGSAWRVATAEGEPRRGVCGAGPGWESASVQRRLNAGEALLWDLPRFVVSLPLTPRFWLELLYGERIGSEKEAAADVAERAADLTGRLVTDARAAQMYLGLAALDGRTLVWLRDHPRTLSRLRGGRLRAFARFGGGLRVHGGEVRVPGGSEAAAFWRRLVGADPADPERFVDRLFARSSGRIAQMYHLAAHLPERQRRFLIGAWRPSDGDRRRNSATLRRVLERLPPPESVFAGPGAEPPPDVDTVAVNAPGRHVCDVPPDEAIALTWELGLTEVSRYAYSWTLRFFACSASRCTVRGSANERDALESVAVDATREGFRYVCQVQSRMDFNHDCGEGGCLERRQRLRTARMYRLGYEQPPNASDPRQFIER